MQQEITAPAGARTHFGPKFTASKFELAIIVAIARRAMRMARDYQVDYSQMDALMDIEAAHCNGCPLQLNALLETDEPNFAHDVFGIRRHIDRSNGELQDCFVPRFAINQGA
jgi:hypothetical protein